MGNESSIGRFKCKGYCTVVYDVILITYLLVYLSAVNADVQGTAKWIELNQIELNHLYNLPFKQL